MANPSGVSLAKGGSSRSVAEKFAEARAATRAPGLGAAAAATLARNAPPVPKAIRDGSPAQNKFAEDVRRQYLEGLKSQRGFAVQRSKSPTVSREQHERTMREFSKAERSAANITNHRFWINHARNTRSNWGRVHDDVVERG